MHYLLINDLLYLYWFTMETEVEALRYFFYLDKQL
jgi:hypothetical protein